MSKTFSNYFNSITSYFWICSCSLLFYATPALACDEPECDGSCAFIDENYEDLLDAEEEIDYSGLGEYENILMEFEEDFDSEDAFEEYDEIEYDEFGEYVGSYKNEYNKRGFLKKWCKKLKRWFKKQIFKIIKSFIKIEKASTPDACARTILQFKRKVDKVHSTGSVEKLISRMEKECPSEALPVVQLICHEIRKEAYGRSYKKSFLDAYPQARAIDIDDFSDKAIFAGLEMGCGVLVCIIPVPGAKKLGFSLISHGALTAMEIYRDGLIENSHADPSKYDHWNGGDLHQDLLAA